MYNCVVIVTNQRLSFGHLHTQRERAMNSMEEVFKLYTTLQHVEELSAAAHEKALVAERNGKGVFTATVSP